MEIVKGSKGKLFIFLLTTAVSLVIYTGTLASLFRFAWRDETVSYIPLVPLVSAWFLFESRKEVFARKVGWFLPGLVPIAVGIALYAIGASQAVQLTIANRQIVMTLSFIVCWVGLLGLCYGPGAWKAASFPLLFLLFMLPIPEGLLDPIVLALQRGSAEVSYAFFRASGIPVYRDGFLFSIPGLTIEVARECSGIRSSLSLLLTMLVAGHLFLKKGWNKFYLCLAVVPVTIFKNGVRIVSLTLLGVYVDRRILDSELHRNGGILFFAFGLVLLGGVLWLLRRTERQVGGR